MKLGRRERRACSAAWIAAAMLRLCDDRIERALLGTSSHIPFVNRVMGGLSTATASRTRPRLSTLKKPYTTP